MEGEVGAEQIVGATIDAMPKVVGTQYVHKNITLWGMLEEVAARHPDKEALVGVDTDGREVRISYGELVRQTRVMSAVFARLGVRRGDRVALWMTNLPQWIPAHFGLMRLGAVSVAVSTWLKPEEIKYFLGHSRARHLLMLDRFRNIDFVSMLEEVASGWRSSKAGRLYDPELPELRNVVVMKRDGSAYEADNAYAYSEIVAAGEDPDALALADAMAGVVRPTDLAMVKYTSGSTGFPKGVMLEQWGIVDYGFVYSARHQMTTGQDRLFSAMPFFHAGGSMWSLMTMLSRGSTLVFIEAFDPLLAVQLIEREQCTAMFGVSAMFRDMIKVIRAGSYDTGSMRIITQALHRSLADELEEVFPNSLVLDTYGLTEAYGSGAQLGPDDPEDKRRTTVGRMLDGFEWKISDPVTREELGAGKVGEITLRGRVMRGYWDMPEQTAIALDDQGWLHTGDLGVVDEEGYLTVVGRIKTMLKTGGENVAVEEVESCIRAFGGVAECVVVGIADPRRDQVGRAYVVPEGGSSLDAEKLTEWCHARLARFKVPAEFVFVESLPYTSNNRMDRAAIQKMADASVRVAVEN
jgi:fatty-acyl-CoA synthase